MNNEIKELITTISYMGKKDKQIDIYIANAQPFAQPILTHLRKLIHATCPDVEEGTKWGMPHFGYKGMMCSMAAFKQHAVFGFWKAAIMNDPHKIFIQRGETAMGHLGQLKDLSDLPSDKILIQYIKEAKRLNDENIKLPPRNKSSEKTKKELVVPDYLLNVLKKNKAAYKTFKDFSYSHKKEYIEWITEAKTEETKNKRIATTLEWLEEGKGKNWKYESK